MPFVTRTDALNFVTTFAYDAADNLKTVTDRRGNVYTHSYDALNRRTVMTDPAAGVTTMVYDGVGNQIAEVNPRGHRVTFTFDALNREIARTDALNHTVTTTYDKASNVIESIDQLGNRTTYAYDALNRSVTMKEPLGGVITTVYDAASNIVNSIDQLGQKTTYVHDALYRTTKIIDPLGGVITQLYDAASNQTGVIDPVGNRTTFVYDALNRVIEEEDPLGESITYAYDAAGRLSSRTDRLGRRRDFGYDAADQQTSETWVASDGSTVVSRLTFSYDGNGNQLTAANGAGTYTTAYDALNRATSVKEPFNLALTFAYDKAGNRTEVRDSTGGIATYSYDAANRFTRQVFTSGGLVTLQYDLAYSNRDELGFITRYNANTGTNVRIGSSLYEYDANGRMTSIIHRDGPGTNLSFTINTFDAANRLWAERDALTNVRITFAYDSTDQLTGDGTRTYTYDANGNRTMSGYQTGSANRMSNDGTWTYTYDDEGNRTKRSKGASAETWEYGYDHRNQLITAEQRATDGGTLLAKVTYTYDAWGYKVEETVWTSASGTTEVKRFGIDAWKTKQDGFGTDASYVGLEGADTWADLDGSNALVYRRLYTAEVDQPVVRVSAAGAMTWYLTDRQQTVGHLVDGAGTLVNTVTYDRYGGKLSESNAALGDRFAWQGQDYNATLGQYSLGVRQYDPVTGRFTSEDPIGFAAGDSHLSRFGRNGPTNRVDPSGYQTAPVISHAYDGGQSPGSAGTQSASTTQGVVGPPTAEAAFSRQHDAFVVDWAYWLLSSEVAGESEAARVARQRAELKQMESLLARQRQESNVPVPSVGEGYVGSLLSMPEPMLEKLAKGMREARAAREAAERTRRLQGPILNAGPRYVPGSYEDIKSRELGNIYASWEDTQRLAEEYREQELLEYRLETDPWGMLYQRLFDPNGTFTVWNALYGPAMPGVPGGRMGRRLLPQARRSAPRGRTPTPRPSIRPPNPSKRARDDAKAAMRQDDALLNEHDAEFYGGDGVIYRVPGSGTPSGEPYVGSANDLQRRAETATDGRDRSKAVVVGRYPIGNGTARAEAEQSAIDAEGGLKNLDNKRNEIKK